MWVSKILHDTNLTPPLFFPGDRLQFVFRCINPKDLEEPYSCIIYFNEEGEYQRK